MLQNLSFKGGRQINAAGSFFRYESGSADGASPEIRLRADGQDLGLYMPGDWVRIPFTASTWQLEPVIANCRGDVRIGVAEVGSSRLVGTVDVVNAAFADVIADRAFLATAEATPIATRFASVQLWNGSSSIAIELTMIGVFTPTPRPVAVYAHLQRLGGATAPVYSKRISTAHTNGVAEITDVITARKTDSVGAVPTGAAQFLAGFNTTNGITELPQKATPVVVGPGTGLTVCATVANEGLGALFEGRIVAW